MTLGEALGERGVVAEFREELGYRQGIAFGEDHLPQWMIICKSVQYEFLKPSSRHGCSLRRPRAEVEG